MKTYMIVLTTIAGAAALGFSLYMVFFVLLYWWYFAWQAFVIGMFS